MTERWHIMDFGLVQPEGHHWGTLAGLPMPETVELIRVGVHPSATAKPQL